MNRTAEEAISHKKKKRIKQVRIKRNKKLLIHVGLIIAITFSLVIGVSAFIQVKGSTRTYLEAKEEFMLPLTQKMKEVYEQLGDPEWFFDRWISNPGISSLSILDGDEYYLEMIKSFPIKENSAVSWPDYDPKKLNSYTKREQALLAIYLYSELSTYQLVSIFQQETERGILIDLSEKHRGTAILDTVDTWQALQDDPDLENFDFQLGEDYSEFLDSLSCIDKVCSTRKTMFERYDSPKDGNYYYLCVSPVLSGGEVKAVYILSHDWSDFHSNLIMKLVLIVGFSAIFLVLASVVLLFFINRSAIRPLAKVQRGVREYMLTKDSDSIVAQMNTIRQRNEFGALADDVSRMVTEIDRYTSEIEGLTAERERVATELALASDIQAGFLPGEFPEAKDYELFASMTPAKEVGGDLYDFFDIDETHVGLVIGDVSGKGVPASLFMMIAKLLIQEYAKMETSPAVVLTKANQTLCQNNRNDMFVTAWFGILDRTTGRIVAASAGHEYPILRNPDGDFELIKDRRGFVLGGMDISRYTDYELQLQPGGTVLVYTDGAAEATNAAEELFGTDRMLEALNRRKEDHPKELISNLTEAINEFVGTAPQFDDLTMLCVRYNG